MGYRLSQEGMNQVLDELKKDYRLFAPRRYQGQGEFSDTDSIRYGEIDSIAEMELTEKSSHTFKEVLLPISETLFYYSEESVKESNGSAKGAVIFLRSCDLHAIKRQDQIYLGNGSEDFYYKRRREHIKFILIGCDNSFENCFCVDMNSNISDDYDASLDLRDGQYFIDNQEEGWEDLLSANALEQLAVEPAHVEANEIRVKIPENLTAAVAKSRIWDQYDSRCIACGRCNFSCPTCSCYTMQDIFYTDNGKAGERRRVWASCMVDGFTDVAGGGCYRKENGQRMRFKVLHKVLDYNQRFGYHMCVGCGRCDDVCPEYISFSHAVNRLEEAVKEVAE